MQTELKISFRDFKSSDAIKKRIEEHVAKLEQFHDRITACDVVVEEHHRHQRKGRLFHIRISLVVPGGQIVISREPHADHAHEDFYVALRDAFRAARRKLEDHVREHRHEQKRHESAFAAGEITKLVAREGYGFIQTGADREIYFHRNAVHGDKFDTLAIGARVRFSEEEGNDGPQAIFVEVLEPTGA